MFVCAGQRPMRQRVTDMYVFLQRLSLPPIFRAGAPLVLKPGLDSKQLRAALRTISVTALTLHHSFVQQEPTYGELVWALAGLSSTLTALQGLPLEELHDSKPHGLAAFTRLRALTLRRQSDEYGAVRARLLPQSLTALRLEAADPGAANLQPPRLIAMGRLQHLRAITIVGHVGCRLSYEDHEEECFGSIPQSLEVQTSLSYAAALYAKMQGCTVRRCMYANFNYLHDFSSLGRVTLRQPVLLHVHDAHSV